MLIFPLKKQWYEKIKSGEKTIEYREVKDYWTKRFISEFSLEELLSGYFQKTCYLQLGYNPNTRLQASIIKIEVVDGKDTDLAIDKPVYAIHLADVKEIEK